MVPAAHCCMAERPHEGDKCQLSPVEGVLGAMPTP